MTCTTDIQMFPRAWHEGDTVPDLAGFVEDLDLTGYTVTGTFKRPDDTQLVKVATLDLPNTFVFNWAAGDLIEGITVLTVTFTTPASAVETVACFGVQVLSC